MGAKQKSVLRPALKNEKISESDNEPLPKTPDTHQRVSGKSKGHGRISADEYTPDETIEVKHTTLKVGDPCPQDCGGRLYEFSNNPGSVIRIKGQSCAHVVRYQFGVLPVK